jgi:hypothetical protein
MTASDHMDKGLSAPDFANLYVMSGVWTNPTDPLPDQR